MANIIKIEKILKPTSQYPIQNILLDTNIIINYEDPFGSVAPNLNAKISQYINVLKSHYTINSIFVTALEYFNYIQVGFYNVFVDTHEGTFEKYSSKEFKQLRNKNSEFAASWNLHLKSFVRTFKKHFPPFDTTREIYSLTVIQNFDGNKVDFGDEILYQYAMKLSYPVILTMDKDFKSYPDELNLIQL